MLRKLLIALAILVALVGVVTLIGYALPVAHTASRTASLAKPTVQVYGVLTDVQAFPQWRSDVKSVEDLSASPRRWREHGSNGEITFEIVEASPSDRLVTRIADQNLPFGGTWTYQLVPEGSGTRLTITEDGEVYNPIFRFMSRFVFGHTATMDQVLTDLKKRVG